MDTPRDPSADELQPASAGATDLGSPFPDRPPPPSTPPDTRATRTWSLVAIGCVVLAISVITIVVAAGDGEGEGLPREVAGYEQVDTKATQSFEQVMADMKFGDIEVTFSFYGQADEVELQLIRYGNLPSGTPVEGILRGAGGGIIGSGGSADIDATTLTKVDGITYHCLPFQGRLFPTDSVEAAGRVCAWLEGADVMLLMNSATDDIQIAAEHPASAHAALNA